MSMQLKPDETAKATADGLTIEQALAYHAGWAAARSGEPFDMKRGGMWVDGWLHYNWLKGQPSAARH